MTHVARLTARLAVALFILLLGATGVSADEIQDIDRLLKRGQPVQALEKVNRYLAQKPQDPKGRFIKGLILAEQNKVSEAIDIFAQLSKDYPELPEPYNNLAVLYAAQGQYDKARQQLELSIRTHPSYATAYENLGDLYTKMASQAYDKALQLDSSNSAAKNKLSLIRDLMVGNDRPPRVEAIPAGTVAEPARPVATARARTESPPAPRQAESSGGKPSEPAAARGKPEGEVIQTVEAWIAAWSNQQVESYLSFYAKDFKTPRGEGRSEWESVRRQRVSGPKQIEVAIESPKVVFKGENEVVVTFLQKYRSDTLKVDSSKTLIMVRGDGRWKIRQERSGS